MAKVEKTQEEWLTQLGQEAFRVTRQAGTERAFSHPGFPKQPGKFTCTCCGEVLFTQGTKFESGCGWPSFFAPADGAPIEEHVDRSLGMERVEVTCENCGAHLGHVFEDGPLPTGQRYCINGVALDFKPEE